MLPLECQTFHCLDNIMRITHTQRKRESGRERESETRHIHSKQMAKVAVEEAVKAETQVLSLRLAAACGIPKSKTKPKKSVYALLQTHTQGNKVNSTAMKCKNNKSCYSFCLTWPRRDWDWVAQQGSLSAKATTTPLLQLLLLLLDCGSTASSICFSLLLLLSAAPPLLLQAAPPQPLLLPTPLLPLPPPASWNLISQQQPDSWPAAASCVLPSPCPVDQKLLV